MNRCECKYWGLIFRKPANIDLHLSFMSAAHSTAHSCLQQPMQPTHARSSPCSPLMSAAARAAHSCLQQPLHPNNVCCSPCSPIMSAADLHCSISRGHKLRASLPLIQTNSKTYARNNLKNFLNSPDDVLNLWLQSTRNSLSLLISVMI